MATTATTLSVAINAWDWIIGLAAPGVKPGDNIVCEQESMKALVTGPGGAAIVYRGSRGTAGKAHAAGAAVTYGAPDQYGVGVGVAMVPLEADAESQSDEPPAA